MRILGDITLAVLVVNGLRVVLGIPPLAYWLRSMRCPVCHGVGHVKLKDVTVTKSGDA